MATGPPTSPDVEEEDRPTLYYVLFPRGIEDVVQYQIKRLAEQLDSDVEIVSGPASKHVLQPLGGSRDAKEQCRTTLNPTEMRGALFFSIDADTPSVRQRSSSTDCSHHTATLSMLTPLQREAALVASVAALRTVEQLGIHITTWTFAAGDTPSSKIQEVVRQKKTAIHAVVFRKVGLLHFAWREMKEADAPFGDAVLPHCARLWGPSYFDAISSGRQVLFRVNCVRRDKTIKTALSSQELSAVVGEALYDTFETDGWGVNMLYYNREFFVVYEANQAQLGVVTSPTPFPRCGSEMDMVAQYGLELLRQKIGVAILSGEVDPALAKAFIPRPATTRYEIRASKGENALNCAIAAALCIYADIGPHTSPLVMLDPFCGSGTTLLEASLLSGIHGSLFIGCDLSRQDAARTYRNGSSPYRSPLAALHGYLSPSPDGQLERSIRRWCRTVENRVDSITAAQLSAVTPVDVMKIIRPFDIDESWKELTAMAVSHSLCSCFESVAGDAGSIPLRDCSVDVIVSDMPFGRRCSSHKANLTLYPAMLKECYRVLRRPNSLSTTPSFQDRNWWQRSSSENECRGGGGGRAVLLTIEGRLMMDVLNRLRPTHPFRLITQPFTIDMGGLYPFVFVLDKEV